MKPSSRRITGGPAAGIFAGGVLLLLVVGSGCAGRHRTASRSVEFDRAPAIGGALFLIDKLIGDRVSRFASVQYTVQGPWKDPKITFDKPFEKAK